VSRHRRGLSSGSGYDYGGWSLSGRMMSAAQAPTPRMLSLTSQASLGGRIPSRRIVSPDRLRLQPVQVSSGVAVEQNLSQRLPAVGGGLRLPRTPSGLAEAGVGLPAVGRRNTLGAVPATPPVASAAPSTTAAGAGTIGMNGHHHVSTSAEDSGEPGTARSQPLSVTTPPSTSAHQRQQQLQVIANGKGPLSWGREPQVRGWQHLCAPSCPACTAPW
jgi:hypothetical protein